MGYPAEIHQVTTEDGYVLELHRIPHGTSGPTGSRPPVLMQHGILGSSTDWVLNTADEALGGYNMNIWCGCLSDSRRQSPQLSHTLSSIFNQLTMMALRYLGAQDGNQFFTSAYIVCLSQRSFPFP